MDDQRFLNTLVKGAGWGFIGIIISKFLTYFYRAVVARIGPDAYGQLSLAITVAGITGTITIFALNTALKKYVPQFRQENDWSSVKGVVLSAAAITTALSLLGGGLMFFFADLIARRIFQSPGLVPLLKVFALVVPFANLSKVVNSTIKGFKQVHYNVFLVNILTSSIQIVVTLILIMMGLGVIGAAWGWAAGVVIPTLVGFWIIERKLGPIVTREVKPEYHAKELLKFSYPLLLSGIIGSILGWTDTLLLGYYMDDAQVGFYNAALPTAALLTVVERSFGKLSLPSMAEISDDSEKMSWTLKTLTRWNTAAVLPGFLLMALFSSQILHLLFGKQYVVAGTALSILAFGKLYSASVGYLGDVIKAVDETQIFWKNSILSFFLNIGLNILLIPGFKYQGQVIIPELGITGAALATTVSLVIMQSVILLEAYYLKGVVPFNRETWKPVAAALVALAATYVGLKTAFTTTPLWALVPGAAVFGSLYVALLLVLGGVEEEDRNVFIDAANRLGRKKEAEKML
ncbi:MAG: flippase, partial [Candidatus Nanohaloarchaea archaeon]